MNPFRQKDKRIPTLPMTATLIAAVSLISAAAVFAVNSSQLITPAYADPKQYCFEDEYNFVYCYRTLEECEWAQYDADTQIIDWCKNKAPKTLTEYCFEDEYNFVYCYRTLEECEVAQSEADTQIIDPCRKTKIPA